VARRPLSKIPAPLGVGGSWALAFQDHFGGEKTNAYNFYPVWGDNSNPQEDTAFQVPAHGDRR
jgi:hypothetical protein